MPAVSGSSGNFAATKSPFKTSNQEAPEIRIHPNAKNDEVLHAKVERAQFWIRKDVRNLVRVLAEAHTILGLSPPQVSVSKCNL